MNWEEPNINYIPSIVFQSYCFRSIWNNLYRRPKDETFHEFLLNIIKWTFGKEWFYSQFQKETDNQHIVFKWLMDFESLKDNNSIIKKIIDDGKTIETKMTGNIKALLQLGYDFYCLQLVNKFPTFLKSRLINDREFQGFRYEIAIAAIIARAGFEIQWLDIAKSNLSQKHGEFIVTHKSTKSKLMIETKSKRRKGSLNEIGCFKNEEEENKIVGKLLQNALNKAPSNIPFIVFVDINLPSKNNRIIHNSEYLNKIADEINYNKKDDFDNFNAIILSNFSYYYAGMNDAPLSDYILHITDKPKIAHPIIDVYEDLQKSLDKYSVIPLEI